MDKYNTGTDIQGKADQVYTTERPFALPDNRGIRWGPNNNETKGLRIMGQLYTENVDENQGVDKTVNVDNIF